ncbi:hypothetical protein [Methylomusa anaerophila]|uniref:hypothetical protein n=1 Tax=Methylomusa anaerophila TaxID=1930071 RepID=UPI0011AE5193|nr:hypothetical protein [Methylomusa anaerophila]
MNNLKKLINECSTIYQADNTPLYVEFITINSDQLLLSLPDKKQLYENFVQNSQLKPKVMAKQVEQIAIMLTREIESDKQILAAIRQGVESVINEELSSIAERMIALSRASDQKNAQISTLTELKRELEDWLDKTVRVQILKGLRNLSEVPGTPKGEMRTLLPPYSIIDNR